MPSGWGLGRIQGGQSAPRWAPPALIPPQGLRVGNGSAWWKMGSPPTTRREGGREGSPCPKRAGDFAWPLMRITTRKLPPNTFRPIHIALCVCVGPQAASPHLRQFRTPTQGTRQAPNLGQSWKPLKFLGSPFFTSVRWTLPGEQSTGASGHNGQDKGHPEKPPPLVRITVLPPPPIAPGS